MKKGLIALLLGVASLVAPSPAQAWGFAGHRLIMERAIALLPPELRPLFEQHKAELLVRVTDPDTWRSVGWEDDPNHFVDFGATAYGEYPFTALPRELDKALEKFGPRLLEDNGRLPWREAEMYGLLRRTFDDFKRQSPYTVSNVVLFAGVASHYIQDATQPFHATINYDGQLTGQAGLHSRFERDLIERFSSRLRLQPQPVQHITSVRDFAFDTLLASYQQVVGLLQADKEAIGTNEVYDDAYFDAFFAKVQPVLEAQLSTAITATASVIVSAWEDAGRPVLRVQDVRPVERVRRRAER